MPVVGTTDMFETQYRDQLRVQLSQRGQLITYENDRAALDLGLHLYDPDGPTGTISQVRVWLQLKGIQASTRGADECLAQDTVPVAGLSVDHVGYWFGHPEPVYLVLYLEALDEFVAADVRDLVEELGGAPWLNDLRASGQDTVTLRIPRQASLESALDRMPLHRSIRLDGPDFRGRPLGHRFDPLRSELDVMEPSAFEEMVWRLLKAHDFSLEKELDANLFGDVGSVSASVGRLSHTYEWNCPLFTEFGFDPNSDYRIESQPFFAQGDALVIIHSEVNGNRPSSHDLQQLVEQLQAEDIEQALVFYNESETEMPVFAGWRLGLTPLNQVPQGLGSLAFNLLISTSIYLDFLDRVSWRTLGYR